MSETEERVLSLLKETRCEYLFDWLKQDGFFEAPASANHHGAYRGALAEHSLAVAEELQRLTRTECLHWQNNESPILIGLLHDVCKMDQYKAWSTVTSEAKVFYDYNKDCLFSGHGDKSIAILAQHITMTEEEVACIRYHMGAFTDSSEWNYYSGAIKKYPNVLWTHTADMIASQIKGI